MLRVVILVVGLVFIGCSSGDSEPSGGQPSTERGSWVPTGKADQNASCFDHCGGVTPSGCWCDGSCEKFGDCCPDLIQQCCPELVLPGADFCGGSAPVAVIDMTVAGSTCPARYKCEDAGGGLCLPLAEKCFVTDTCCGATGTLEASCFDDGNGARCCVPANKACTQDSDCCVSDHFKCTGGVCR